jgi:hypothetical protein
MIFKKKISANLEEDLINLIKILINKKVIAT